MFRDHNNIVEKDASVRFEQWGLFLLLSPDLFVDGRFMQNATNRHISATKAPMTKPEHTPSLARRSRE